MSTPSPMLGSPRALMQRSVAITAIVCVVGCAVLALADSWSQVRMLRWARALGWAAAGSLLATLSLSPAARIALALNTQVPAGLAHLRRALGIATALLALLHAAVSYVAIVHPQPLLLWTWPHLHFGALALFVLLLLLATSFPRIVAALHLHAWKELHRLAYVAAVFSLMHAALSPWAPRALLFWVYGLWAALSGLSWMAAKWAVKRVNV